MATYTVQTANRAGVQLTKNAVASSDEFANDGRTAILVTNGSGGILIVTIVTTSTVDGLAVADRAVSIPDGEERIIGPFPAGTYGAIVTLQYDGTTSVTCQVFNLQ